MAIYGKNILTPAQDSLLLVVDNDPDKIDSRGYMSYTDEECYISISARKMDGTLLRLVFATTGKTVQCPPEIARGMKWATPANVWVIQRLIAQTAIRTPILNLKATLGK